MAKTVIGTAPFGQKYGFSLSCTATGTTPRTHTFTRKAGETGYVPVHAPGLLTGSINAATFRTVGAATCTLTEPANHDAVPIGLFTGQVITRSGHAATVTNAHGPIPPVTISIEAPPSPIIEGGDGEFTITANPAPLFDLPVDLRVTTSGDYGVRMPYRDWDWVVIPAGQTSAAYGVKTSADAVDEPNGTVTVEVVDSLNRGEAGRYQIDEASARASVTIADNDGGGSAVPATSEKLSHVSIDPKYPWVTRDEDAVFDVRGEAARNVPTVTLEITTTGDQGPQTRREMLTIPVTATAEASVEYVVPTTGVDTVKVVILPQVGRYFLSSWPRHHSATVKVRDGSVHPKITVTAVGGATHEASPGDMITLQGWHNIDPLYERGTDEATYYKWVQASGPTADLGKTTLRSLSMTIPNEGSLGTVLTFRLTVRIRPEFSTIMDTGTGTVILKVVAPPTGASGSDGPESQPPPRQQASTAPTANAGPDLTGAPGESVTLQGKGSTNPYGRWHQMAHQWTQLSGPTATLTHPQTSQPASNFGDPRFIVPADVADGTTLEFELTVTDQEGESNSDTMTVTVAVTETIRPTAKAGPDLTGAPGESVTLQGKGSTNPYGRWHQMAHAWTQLSGPNVTLTHPQESKQAANKFGDPRFTLPADAAGGTILEFQLTVTDQEGESDSDTMTVTVPGAEPEPANTPPTASIDAAQVTAAVAGEAVALQGVGGDAETTAESLTFAWSQVGGTPTVSIVSASTATAGFTAPDVTEQTELTFRLTVTDAGGLSASAETTIAVSPPPEPENTPPTFDEGDSAIRSLVENTAAGQLVGAPLTATDPDDHTLSYSLSGDDAGSFDIDAATGQLLTKFGVSYDYETQDTYSLTVTTDDGNAAATIAVTVSLTDVNETPSATSCFTNLNELTASVEYAGEWDDTDCRAHHRDSPARYFHFTLSQETTVEIRLASEADAQLFVSKDTPRNGWGKRPNSTYETRRTIRRNNGKLVHDGAHTGSNSVTLTLAAGEYTAEATGPASDGAPGTFTLNIQPQ